ncbi:uncharacterized protein LOC122248124 [Penaeus japonicus]|uniref:uncharacterized protein LOC122248124 n=1 Tax=Penaeus japonicus TaxID=27405 RepID=UPI001C717021|nr:uncharacterized protein LOC122248124 [Penaeus japonicus]XP_042863880.1 uncharacterized protein LOC122248124 [Penaeus japonicus]XP_042863882.1 uncharacterized protein LOC122248124 [Penaeus japonicus]
MACCSVSSLKVSTIVLGSIGLVIWPTAIGFTCGYGFYGTSVYYGNPVGSMMLSIILIGVNIAYMYLTSLIIFNLTGSKQLTREAIESVRKNTARLVAFLLVGFAEWATSLVWFVMYGLDWDGWFVYVTLFACSFSFVWTVVVAAVAGSLTHIYGETGMEVPQDQFPMVGNPQQQFHHQDPPRYESQAREPNYAHPKRNTSGAPVHGHVSPWADHI